MINSDDPLVPLSIQKFVLEKARLGLRLPVDSYIFRDAQVSRDDLTEHLFDQMVYNLETYVLQDKLPPQEFTETRLVTSEPAPATWWDHFKHEYKDRTWLKHLIVHLKPPLYHAKTKEVTFKVNLERWISYPEAQNIPESFGNRYHGHKVDTSFWESKW